MKTKHLVSVMLCLLLLVAIAMAGWGQAQTSPANGGASAKRFTWGKAILAQLEAKRTQDAKHWIAFSVSGLPTVEIYNWDALAPADQQTIRTAFTAAGWAED